MFHCHWEEVEGVFLLSSDLSVTCYDEVHKVFYMISGSLLLLYALGFPLSVVVVLQNRRSSLRSHLFFLTEGYDMERFPWWEATVLLRKLLIQVACLWHASVCREHSGLVSQAQPTFVRSIRKALSWPFHCFRRHHQW